MSFVPAPAAPAKLSRRVSSFTLKLKLPTRKSPREPKTPPPRPKSKLSQKPGAAWSDELKVRMQEDMDALIAR
jgi:hypothetical protein